jgi:hypothetical protein
MPRLTVEFPDKINDMLGELSAKEGTTKVGIIRRALALYDYVQKEAFDKQNRLSIRDKDGKVVTDIVMK